MKLKNFIFSLFVFCFISCDGNHTDVINNFECTLGKKGNGTPNNNELLNKTRKIKTSDKEKTNKITKIKPKRGRPKKDEMKINTSIRKDNMRRKVVSHFLNYMVTYCNKLLEEYSESQFRTVINFSSYLNKKIFDSLFYNSTVGEILSHESEKCISIYTMSNRQIIKKIKEENNESVINNILDIKIEDFYKDYFLKNLTDLGEDNEFNDTANSLLSYYSKMKGRKPKHASQESEKLLSKIQGTSSSAPKEGNLIEIETNNEIHDINNIFNKSKYKIKFIGTAKNLIDTMSKKQDELPEKKEIDKICQNKNLQSDKKQIRANMFNFTNQEEENMFDPNPNLFLSSIFARSHLNYPYSDYQYLNIDDPNLIFLIVKKKSTKDIIKTNKSINNK